MRTKVILIFFIELLILSCGGVNNVKKKSLLTKNEIVVEGKKSNSIDLSEIPLQKPNAKIAGIRLQMILNNLALDDPDSLYQNWLHKNPRKEQFLNSLLSEKQTYRLGQSFLVSGWSEMFREVGERPRILDEKKVTITEKRFEKYYFGKGYFNAKATSQIIPNKDTTKVKVKYFVNLGRQFLVDSISTQVDSPELQPLFKDAITSSIVKKDDAYQTKNLELERERITKYFRDQGAYHFQTNNITYAVDTINTNGKANIKILIKDRVEQSGDTTRTVPFRMYKISKVNVFIESPEPDLVLEKPDTITYNGVFYQSKSKLNYRPQALSKTIFVQEGQLYSDGFRTITNNAISNLRAFEYPSIQYVVDKTSEEPRLITNIYLKPKDKISTSIGTNVIHSSIEDIGFTFDGSVGVRNFFKGAELLEFSGRGNIGYSKDFSRHDGAFFNISEYGFDTKLTIPRFITPTGFRKWVPKRMLPVTLFSVGFFKQQNIGLDKQNLIALIGYNWRPKKNVRAQLDLLNVQYIRNVNKLNYFNVYRTSYTRLNEVARVYNVNPSNIDGNGNLIIESGTNTFISEVLEGNTVLNFDDVSYQSVKAIEERKRRLTENNLIVASNFQIDFNTKTDLNDESYYAFKTKIESAGLLMTLLSRADKSNEGLTQNRSLYNVNYSQYGKVELEYIKHWDFTRHKVVAFRCFSGIAIPYGNSNNIPFSRSYFAGGANDNRAWQPYRLGPGRSGSLNDFNEANFKIALNLEYRFKIYNKIHGAFFVDAGNIWNLYDNVDDPDYMFQGFKSLQDLAVGSGLGIRYDFSFFVFRVDVGFKNYDPSYANSERWRKGYTFNKSVINIGVNYPF